MTNRERVIAALNHKETDSVPFHADATYQLEDELKKAYGHNILTDYNLHLEYVQYWGYPTERGTAQHFTDDFGVTWNRSGADKEIGVIDTPVITEPNISMYPQPFLDEARIRRECQALVDSKSGNFKFFGIGFSMFERFWSYCGFEDAFIYMATEPAFTHSLLDRILEFNCRVIEIANEYPLDGFYFGDDWGSQTGLMTGLKLWREFIKPRMAKMYALAQKGGKFILQHSCGNIEDCFDDLADIGLSCYQTVQPEIYDLKKIKKNYGSKLSFWGGISTQRLLPYASGQEILDTVKSTREVMSEGGGYILAPTHAMTFDIPTKNVKAMLDAFSNKG